MAYDNGECYSYNFLIRHPLIYEDNDHAQARGAIRPEMKIKNR